MTSSENWPIVFRQRDETVNDQAKAIATLTHLFMTRGAAEYGGEPVSQLEHALQCAALAETGQASHDLITAALLHDIGHLWDGLGETRSEQDCSHGPLHRHEYRALPLLTRWFGPSVTEPIRLHVEAKQYLCAIQRGYFEALSAASQMSLMQQGGIFTAFEAQQFIQHPFAKAAVQLRQWDDQAKICGQSTPDLDHFLPILTHSLV